MNKEYLRIEEFDDQIIIHSMGEWTLYNEPKIHKILQKISPDRSIIWDFSKVENFDTSGVLLFMAYYEKFKEKCDVKLIGYSTYERGVFAIVWEKLPSQPTVSS